MLIQGAGAVAAAAGALLAGTGAEVRAASRRPGAMLTAVAPDGAVTHVPVVPYAEVAPGTVDLLVLTSAPGELAPEVATALIAVEAPTVGVTSPVIGDAAIAQRMFPGAEVATLAPGLLSFATSRGTETRAEYWVPPLAPAFAAVAVDGASELPRRLATDYPKVVGRTPAKAADAVGVLMVPYAAELAVVGGDWPTFLRRLRRPGRAMAEAMRADIGLPVFAPPPIVVRAVLRQLDRTVPFDFPKFAGNHFVRHAEQSLRILDAWRAMTPRATPALDSLRGDLAAAL
ncbi:hypothetical protein AXK60_04315 [Tsukamurella pseudospumae]|uniref:Ketopantoate reductase N-terminal domain-containing protein n=1 Tax=Tsukamurella pseudospumae TaxID=239498 RepID=A0A138AXA5_9ACTN|nr:hypothetical protein AXK60_04315 [Tsukamurella pseudospumae]